MKSYVTGGITLSTLSSTATGKVGFSSFPQVNALVVDAA